MRKKFVLSLALGLTAAAGAANAGNISWSVGVNLGPPPLYVAPAPVYYAPPPPRVVYVRPAPVYYGPPAYYAAPVVVYHSKAKRHRHGHRAHRH